VGAILAGVAARVLLYAQNASLWFDEILLALNIATRSYLHLGALRFDQSAPPLYLWLERLCVDAFGVHAAGLRLPALAAGVAVLVLVAALGYKTGGPNVAALATGIAAFSANLCRYSNEVKPYSGDAAVSAALLLLAWPAITGGMSGRRLVVLAVAGAIAVFLSTPSVFVLAGIAAALWLRDWRRPQVWLVVLSAVWCGSFALAYAAFYAPVARSAYMRNYWAGARLSLSSGVLKAIATIGNAFTAPALGLDNVSLLLGIVGIALLAAGALALYRTHGVPAVVLFCGPLALAVCAALTEKWMPVVRLMLFTAPPVCVAMAMGAWQAAQWPPKAMRTKMFWLLAAAILAMPLKYTIWRVRHPELESNREVVAACLGRVQAGDVVYVYPRSTAAWVLYATDWSAADRTQAEAMMAAMERSGPNAGNIPSRHAPVAHEGFDWRFTRSGRVELFGVPTGIQSTTAGNSGEPDPGWTDNEIDRMIHAGSAGRIWILAASYQQEALEALLARLAARQLQPDLVYSGEWAKLYRIERAGS
jgi:hypothetical protein